MTIASTLASTGRSMKNLEIIQLAGGGAGSRSDLVAGDGAVQPGDNDVVIGLQSGRDDSQRAIFLAGFDVLLLDHVIPVDDEDVAPLLIRAEGHVRHEQRGGLQHLGGRAHVDEIVWQQVVMGIVHDHPRHHRAGGGIRGRRDVVEPALIGIAGLRRQPDPDRYRVRTDLSQAFLRECQVELLASLVADGKGDIDRVESDNIGERGRTTAAPNELAQ